MTVTQESEGRLNAFAKEPEIEVIENNNSSSKGSRLFFIFGGLLLAGLIALSFTI
tara:strand:- start:844 stop:1008 length:165 start_codon:yes stop_codon:yes gene_type:complete